MLMNLGFSQGCKTYRAYLVRNLSRFLGLDNIFRFQEVNDVLN